MPSIAIPRRTVLLGAALGLSVPLLQACGGGDDAAELPNVVQLAQATPDLSILVEAVVAAGLTDTLSTSTVTVFAPTNAAFAALLTELGISKQALLADKALLTQVLTFHVLGSRVLRNEVPLGKAIEPLGDGFFKVESDTALRITDGRNRVAQITTTDILARNGVVHLIDRVLLPASRDIVQLAQARPELSLLVEAVIAAGLDPALQAPGPLTVFAPTNAAFDALPAGTVQTLLKPENKAKLQAVLKFHVLGAAVESSALAGKTLTSPPTLQGGTLAIDGRNGVTVAGAKVVAADIRASNGIIHVIDKVLLPAN